MKKTFLVRAIAVVAIAAMCVCGMVACSGQSSGNTSSEKKVMKIGYDKSRLPQGASFADGTQAKFFIDSVCKQLNWTPEYVGMNVADVEKAMNDGTIDCYWDCYTIEGRHTQFAWSDPYLPARITFVAKSGDNVFDNAKGFVNFTDIESKLPTGRTVAVDSSSITVSGMNQAQKDAVAKMGTLKEYPSLADCKKALDAKEVDMVLTELAAMTPLFDASAYCQVVMPPQNGMNYGVAMKRGTAAKTVSDLNDALRNVFSSGTLKDNVFAFYGNDKQQAEEVWKLIDADWILK